MTDERTKAALRELALAKAKEGDWKESFNKALTPQQIEQQKQRKLSDLYDKIIGQMPVHIKPELSPSYMNFKYGKN